MGNMPTGNPSPVITPEVKARPFKPQGIFTADLSKKAIAVKLPVDVTKVVRSVPNMAAWLRRVITETAQRELMGKEGES